MIIHQNYSLKKLNTFGIDVRASFYVRIDSIADLQKALEKDWELPLMILGGGSNMLLTHNLERVVLHICIKGIEQLKLAEDKVQLRVAAGENWHELVLYCLEKGYGGLENLSLIPGNVGTAPIQNIGAYGVELRDVFLGCQVVSIKEGSSEYMDKAACQFGYRDSVFKRELKGKVIITSIDIELTTRDHFIKTTYGDIASRLKEAGIEKPSISDVSEAVIAIRQAKLPDPAQIGNSGSFFKNPELPRDQFDRLQQRFPDIPHYPAPSGRIKVPAGWLIDQCGLKGFRRGDAGVHQKQALVLVNYGEANGKEILNLAKHVQEEVMIRFGIQLTPEVNIL
ncbi:UDP-N-acetylmuramate dehydrogenase [Aureitalea marina]|uniref:UDP-N-acetylenolpyruvoylglucosamine reductase n=1 Tax=Aureitalea marina TaxID=930804 RepID=A0A2S7KMB1_9FLAO|nr:UDP-N-acetylmuramate dehydrogenase [Aureitalea marina]PQB03767.1 UDP-N-acetylenolpyruvoylglucosamine reductase [Aureitalea marina]